jgi:site-specific recombinase XerD
MTSLPAIQDASFAVQTALAPDLATAADYARAEKAPLTRKAYGSDYLLFRAWCGAKGVSALPAAPETVAAFLAAEAEAGVKPSTLGRRLAAVRYIHKL